MRLVATLYGSEGLGFESLQAHDERGANAKDPRNASPRGSFALSAERVRPAASAASGPGAQIEKPRARMLTCGFVVSPGS